MRKKNYKTSKHKKNTYTTKICKKKKFNILKLSSNKKGQIYLIKVENPKIIELEH